MGPPPRWVWDFEFLAPPGGRPRPVCAVAMREVDRKVVRHWLWDVKVAKSPAGFAGCEMVGYAASAEIGCLLELGWSLPESVIDLHAEHRVQNNGVLLPGQFGLLDAVEHYGGITGSALSMARHRKRQMIKLIADRGPPWSPTEARAILDYCESDVVATMLVWRAMRGEIDLPRARLRGAYSVTVAKMEVRGVPIDAPLHELMAARWDDIRGWIASLAEAWYPRTYVETSFSERGFEWWLRRKKIQWPRHVTGRLKLDDDTMRVMAALYPELQRLREARKTLGRMRTLKLTIGGDARNRTAIRPFASKTGRNQPSNSRSVFGGPKWIRSLIRPVEGRAIAYVDWRQQEFGVAAALSGDPAMLDAYRDPGGDPYIAFARAVGAVPAHATDETHAAERATYKIASLAILYGMGKGSLAHAIGADPPHADLVIDQHRRTYPAYWSWSANVATTMMMRGHLETRLGWRLARGITDGSAHAAAKQDRTVRNFPVQATGSDMLRVACVLAEQAGVEVCMPVHDALLIEADADEIADAVVAMRKAMADASTITLKGVLTLRTSVEQLVRWPERYRDKKGQPMWTEICRMLGLDP